MDPLYTFLRNLRNRYEPGSYEWDVLTGFMHQIETKMKHRKALTMREIRFIEDFCNKLEPFRCS